MKIHLALPFPPPLYGPSVYSENLLSAFLNLGYSVRISNTETNDDTKGIGSLSFKKNIKVFKNLIVIFIKSFNAKTFININLSPQGLLRTFLYFISAYFFSKEINIIFHEGNIKSFFDKYPYILKKVFKFLIRNSNYLILLDKQQQVSLSEFKIETKLIVLGAYREDSFEEVKKKNQIVFYSNLIQQKGVEDAINAYLNLTTEKKSKWQLIIAGNIRDSEFYKKLYKEYENEVIFYNDKTYSDYMDLLKKSKIFIFPTKYKFEQQPAVIIEALMNRMVVLSYDWAGVKTMLPTKSSFISKDNVGDLNIKLNEVLNLKNITAYMDDSRKHYIENFTKELFVEKLKFYFK